METDRTEALNALESFDSGKYVSFGYAEEKASRCRNAAGRPGIYLVSGRPGTGKTVTLKKLEKEKVLERINAPHTENVFEAVRKIVEKRAAENPDSTICVAVDEASFLEEEEMERIRTLGDEFENVSVLLVFNDGDEIGEKLESRIKEKIAFEGLDRLDFTEYLKKKSGNFPFFGKNEKFLKTVFEKFVKNSQKRMSLRSADGIGRAVCELVLGYMDYSSGEKLREDTESGRFIEALEIYLKEYKGLAVGGRDG